MTRRVAILVAVEARDEYTDEHVAAATAAVLRWAIDDGTFPRVAPATSAAITGVAWAEPIGLRPGYELNDQRPRADTRRHDHKRAPSPAHPR